VTPVTAQPPREKVLKLPRELSKRPIASGRGESPEMSAAVAKALRSGNLWLTLAYCLALLLIAKAYT
jgi:hypothetical protein